LTKEKVLNHYKPSICWRTKYNKRIKPTRNMIKIIRSFGILNKFFNGVNTIKIRPIILLIKNRG